MGILQKKCRTTGKKALAYRGRGGQNTDIAFLAVRLGVVLHLLNILCFSKYTHEIYIFKLFRGLQYSFQGSSELISITVTVSLFF